MRSRAHARFVVVLFLLTGCQGYVRSSAPVSPRMEIVRVPFKHPQVIVIARDDPAAGWSDTLDAVKTLEGTITELRGETLRMDVERFHRNGQWQRVPAGRHAMIDMSTVARVERQGFSWQRTAFAGVGVVILVALAAGVIFVVGMSQAYD